MAILTPTDYKPLVGPHSYVMSFQKFPDFSFLLQEVNLPPLSLGVASFNTSVNDVPVPGEALEFQPLKASFIVDEKFKNYFSIHEWLVGMGFPVDHGMYRNLLANSKALNNAPLTELANGYTDGTLIILGNNNLPIMEVTFVDCFPTYLSGIEFSSNGIDAGPITASIEISYAHYLLKVSGE